MAIELNSINQSGSIQNISENRQFKFKHRTIEKLDSLPHVVISGPPDVGFRLEDLKDPTTWAIIACAVAAVAFCIGAFVFAFSPLGLFGAVGLPLILGSFSIALAGGGIGSAIIYYRDRALHRELNGE